MPYARIEDLRRNSARYYASLRDAKVAYAAQYRAAHKGSVQYLQDKRARADKYKESTINMYSDGEAVCAWCGQGDMDVLTIDHINNDGSAHRKAVGSGSVFYRWARANDYPLGFQVLCMSCNMKKEQIHRRTVTIGHLSAEDSAWPDSSGVVNA